MIGRRTIVQAFVATMSRVPRTPWQPRLHHETIRQAPFPQTATGHLHPIHDAPSILDNLGLGHRVVPNSPSFGPRVLY